MSLGAAQRLRRLAASVSLVIASGLIVVGGAAGLAFTSASDALGHLAELGANLTAARVAAATFILAQAFLLAGLLGVVRALRGPPTFAADAAAAMLVMGTTSNAVLGGIRLASLEMVFDAERYAPLQDILWRSPLVLPFIVAGMIGSLVGLGLIAIAIWRAGFAPRWVPTTMIAGVAIATIGAASAAIALLGAALLGVALAALALPVWRAAA